MYNWSGKSHYLRIASTLRVGLVSPGTVADQNGQFAEQIELFVALLRTEKTGTFSESAEATIMPFSYTSYDRMVN